MRDAASKARGDVRLYAQRLARAQRDIDTYQRAIARRVAAGHLTVAETARLCGVSPRTIRRWRDTGGAR